MIVLHVAILSTLILGSYLTNGNKQPNFLIMVSTDHPVNAISIYNPHGSV